MAALAPFFSAQASALRRSSAGLGPDGHESERLLLPVNSTLVHRSTGMHDQALKQVHRFVKNKFFSIFIVFC